jgi:protein-disulfide isomerase
MSNSRESGFLNWIFAGLAICFAGFAFSRLLGGEKAPPPEPMGAIVSNWQEALNFGITLGDSLAPVTLLVLSDFECPACAGFQDVIDSLRNRYPTQLKVVHVHFPLRQHRFARPAARAAECAYDLGRFEHFARIVYRKQDSLGIKPWTSFASEAGITDTMAINSCAMSPLSIPRIELGRQFAERVGVNGTPGIILQGWRFSHPPGEDELYRAVDYVVNGGSPEQWKVGN